jgi:tellurite resistance protein
MDFFPEIPINEHQAQAIARGLYTVASVDGVHEREAALIANFYGSVLQEDSRPVTSLAELARLGTLAPADLAAALPNSELRELFVKAALLLAYVDGKVTAEERAQLGSYAAALGVTSERQAKLEDAVRDQLMLPLATLANTEAVQKVAKTLGR